MSLREEIDANLKDSMKSGNAKVRGVLRLVNSDIKNFEIEKKIEASDADIIEIIRRGVKRRKDSIEQYSKGGRQDLAEIENEEKQILEKYLPAQLNENEIRVIVQKVIAGFGSVGTSEFGRVMGLSMKGANGMADGNVVGKIVKEELGKK